MKRITTLFVSMCISVMTFAQFPTSGGPDAWGYSFITSDDVAGPTFNWMDISQVGTQINGLGDDNFVGPFNIGFNLPYYWTTATKFYVGSNGYISFGTGIQISSGTQASFFPAIPTQDGKENFIAPFLADLNFTQNAGGAVNPAKAYYYSNGVDSLIIQFDSVAFWTNNTDGWAGMNSFQIVFNAVDSSILIQYKDQQGSWNSSYDTGNNPCVIGLENITGSVGLQIAAGIKPTANLAIKITRTPTTIAVDDAESTFNQNDVNGGFFGVVGRSMDMSARVTNVGTTDLTTSFTVNTYVQNSSVTGIPFGAKIYNEFFTVNSMLQGTNLDITYTNQFTPPTTGAKWMITTLQITDDNSTNNMVRSELQVLPNTDSMLLLSYTDLTGDGVVGFEGAAVYFEPPVYPVDITELRYHLVTDDGNPADRGFSARVYASDGPNGSAGTLLYQEDVLNIDAIHETAVPTTGLSHDIFLMNPIQIDSGGFYVTWVADAGTGNLYVAADNVGPYSNRGFEVLQGSFGTYRSNDVEDIMISAVVSAPQILGTKNKVNDNVSASLFPNPANGMTNLKLQLNSTQNVSVDLANVIGQQVKSFEFSNLSSGNHNIELDLNGLESGIYFYTVTVGKDKLTNKLIIK